MQQIPEQSQISIFSCESANENERISPGSMNDQFKFNRYSSSSLDSGRGSDSIKVMYLDTVNGNISLLISCIVFFSLQLFNQIEYLCIVASQ